MNGVKKRLQKKYPPKPNFLLQPIQAMRRQSPTYTMTMATIMALPHDIEFAANNLIPGAEITHHVISAGCIEIAQRT
jgi:hypothetical protein